QVAIQLKCHNYNSTYVHRTFSFESVLTDALMQIDEGMADTVLAGAIDEMTLNHLQITRRIGQWKQGPVNNLRLLESKTAGALAGEGAGFFLLAATPSPSTYCRIQDVAMGFNCNGSLDKGEFISRFLATNGLTHTDVDLLVLGMNGDSHYDLVYDRFAEQFFPSAPRAWYKHLCGEYHTASGFGVYVAGNILKRQELPDVLCYGEARPDKLVNVLIYNQYQDVNHSFILLRKA
ncbi:MAG TPA: hypothetical protein PLK82_06865, partial [Bacteroidales bacterium]|nr:hypothetical protein [Bacteroidales bacterium]